MPDSGFREVHLGSKQVVFLFIASSVALVGVFLLGVTVGYGVIQPDAATEATPTPANNTPAAAASGALPPPTTPAPGELRYHEVLQGKPDVKGTVSATPSPTLSATPPPTGTPKPVTTPTPTPTPAKPTPTATTTAVWYVQVNSFSTNANALKQLSQLKAKGIDAIVFDARGAGARYKVRVGPLERAAADAMMLRLRKEGFTPSRPIR